MLGSAAPQQSDPAAGERMMSLIERLYPLPRSITGDAVRQTLQIIAEELPVEFTEVPSGTRVLDWTVPDEWNLKRATLTGPDGSVIADSDRHSLHVVSYSEPFAGTMTLDQLRPHLHSDPKHADWIPYRTSYYKRDWGFCLPHRQLQALPPGEYRVSMDTTLEPGHLTYAELVLPGQSEETFLLSSHVCHPSMCNDNLSGIAVASELMQWLARRERRYTYRLLLAPGTIGAITWLSRNGDAIPRIRHGMVLSGLGDSGSMTYKQSRQGKTTIDRAAAAVLASQPRPGTVVEFSPYGYDERQFCSPGFDLPVGVLSRSTWGSYPEYHTSADNLSFVSAGALAESLGVACSIIEAVEANHTYINREPFGEPQLGRRGLYDGMSGSPDDRARQMAMLWVLNQSDGRHDLLDIATRSKLAPRHIIEAATMLEHAGLLQREPEASA